MKLWKTIPASLLLCTLTQTVPSAQTSTNPWFNDYLAYDGAHADDYVDDPDAAFIGWQESLLLRSYLNLYTATNDTGWLTKFKTHVATVMANLNNDDGDIYPDWTTARYSPPIVSNGLFTNGDTDDTLPAGWTRWATTTSAMAHRTSDPGEYISSCNGFPWGLELVSNGSVLPRLVQTVAYQPGWRYRLSIYGKNAATATVHGRVVVFDITDNAEIESVEVTSTNWANYFVDFEMPPVGHTVRVFIEQNGVGAAGQSTFFDNVRVSPYYAYQIIDGMIGVPLANFVRLVHQTPALQAAFGNDANDYQTFLEDTLIAKWHDSAGFYGDTWVNASATEGYYKEPTTRDTFESGTSFNPLPYNQTFGLLEIQDVLFDVNASATYRDRAEQGATHFKNRLAIPANESAYTWYYAPFAGSKVEDTSHSNVDMEFITDMHRSGSVFTDEDMDRFTATLTDLMWDDTLPLEPKLFDHVDGEQYSYCDAHQFSRIMYGWVPYAQFDERVWGIAALQYAAIAAASHTEALTLSQIMLWDPLKLTNQGFELAASGQSKLPARWSRLMATEDTAFRDAANKSTGDWGLTLVSDNTTWHKLTQPWTGYTASTSYTVTFDGKADASGANGRVWIINQDTGATIAAYNFSNTSWQSHSFTFTSPSTDTTHVQIQLGHQDYHVVGGKAHFDNVKIKRTGDPW